jgi:heme/copper-type cytochrome/quinol oxidase subunit 2
MESSQEAANQANIKTARLTFWILILTVVLVLIGILTLFFLIYPPSASQAPLSPEGGLVKTLIIVLSSSIVLATSALLIAAFRLLKLKRLATEISKLTQTNKDLRQEVTDRDNTIEERRAEFAALQAANQKLTNELALATPNKRLVTIANNDAAEIQNVVTVTGVQFRNEIEYGQRYIDFVFAIFNQSLYDISIDDELGEGDIIFNKHPLVSRKRIEENKAQNIQPRTPGHFTVRQFLDSGDIDAIKRANSDRRFEFHNLKIKIKGGAGFEGNVREKRLQFEGSLSKEYPTWFNYDGPFRSRFNASIGGRINMVYFKHELDVVNTAILQDSRVTFYFILHIYIANHGAPTGIDRFRLILKAGEETHEGKRLPLTDCHWIRPGAEEHLSERDIESQSDATLTDTRRGWLQFVVHRVKEIDQSSLEIALDVIDKEDDANRLNSLPQDKWIESSIKNESYINGPGIWQQF